MRAFKYDKVDQLPGDAMLVSAYAREMNWEPAYVYVKLERSKTGEGKPVTYTIINWQGMNFVTFTK